MDNTFFKRYRIKGETFTTVPLGSWQVVATTLEVADGFRVMVTDLVRVEETPVMEMAKEELALDNPLNVPVPVEVPV